MRELTLPAPLVLLPGLGADERLFGPQREAFGDALHVPEWIAPRSRGESLRAYAQRWAEPINTRVAGFSDDRPWFLGGASMGGMLALEMVPHLDRLPGALLLIASARSTPQYPAYVKLSAAVLNQLPPKAAAALLKWSAVPIGVRDGLDDPGYQRLAAMAREADPERYLWSMGAAAEWTYAGPPETVRGQPFPPIRQIHGADDWMMPLPESDVDLVIDKAKHVLTLSHDRTVNRWLFEQIAAFCDIDLSQSPRVEDPDETIKRRPEIAARY
jgi:pimeloyl-ACP methyl ester carboxylesterase